MPHALITGASSGIGAALAVELARRGWDVSVLARRAEALQAVAADVEATGQRACWAPADVLDTGALREAIATCVDALGPVDLVIANAGGGQPTPAAELDADKAAWIMRLNYEATLYTFEAVLPSMLERGSGHLAATSSIAGLLGLPPSAAYSATKAAMQVLLQGFGAELRSHGIAVTSINPGFVRTPGTDKNDFDMPFIWEVDKAARVIADGLERRKRVIEFPFPLVAALRIARTLPSPVIEWLLRTLVMRRAT